METEPTELQLKALELELRGRELELERTKLFVMFARFGFSGTLMGAGLGMALILAMAALSAYSPLKIDPWVLLGFMFLVMIGVIAFGFLSLWQLPTIVARFSDKLQLSVNEPKK